VQTYVSRLRALLGPAPDGGPVLVRAGDGYRLRVAADGIDLQEFRRLTVAARQARAAGDAVAACGAFERALELWRGDPLVDVHLLRDHPAVVALAAERAAVTLEYADLASASGWQDRVVRHLRRQVTWDPLDEAALARLMVALAGSGRQAEALRLYEELARRLDEQLAVAPGAEVRAAHARVLRQEVTAAGDAAGGATEGVAGWRQVFQLPAAIADFTGRAADRERLIGAVTPGDDQHGVPVAVISGPPGAGKTALALHAAHAVRSRFPDGQLWVHLAGTSPRPRDPGDVLGEFLRTLGVPGSAIPDDGARRAALFRSRLAGRRVLVVADDAASAGQVAPLLPGTAGCALLVTGRVQLEGLGGAWLMPLEVMTPQDAMDLLARMAGAGRVAAEPDAAIELVRACGGLPLALRIVGARLAARPAWPVSAMLRRLAGERRLGELDAAELSVRASIASSYRSLSPRAQRLFRLLAPLGPADFAEWVPGVLLGEPDALAAAEELVTRSLLTPLGADVCGEPRYRLHDLLRDYAAERLDLDPIREREAAAGRLLAAWLQLVRLACARLPPNLELPRPAACPHPDVIVAEAAQELTKDPLAWLTAERDNLRAAVEHACDIGRWELAGQLTSGMYACDFLQDPRDEELLWRKVAQAADLAGDQVGAALARFRSAVALDQRGNLAEAAVLFDACIRCFGDAGAREALAFALFWRASCAFELKDFEVARSLADQCRAAARLAGNRPAELFSSQILGISLASVGQYDAGVAACEQALAIAEELGGGVSSALHGLAQACGIAGQHERALALSARMLDLARDSDEVVGQAYAHVVMGDACHALGRFHDAVDAFAQAQPIFLAKHADRGYAICTLKRAHASQALGLPETASLLEQSLRMFEELGLSHNAKEARQALGSAS
jgi:DNA-binding SARP family transcriptional activator/tetratricopeptide (TPR) repeat protein